MHEVIGHASGRISERLKGNPQSILKEQYSALEESRADLVALYFLPNPKLVELGLVKAQDQAEIVQAEYEGYTRNAIVQLRRVREGTQIEEDHMPATNATGSAAAWCPRAVSSWSRRSTAPPAPSAAPPRLRKPRNASV